MKRISSTLILQFTQSMSALLKSGLQVQEALTVCAKTVKSRQNEYLCRTLLESVSSGEKLSTSLRKFPESFSSFYIELISIGEMSGAVCAVFEKLSEYLKQKNETRKKIIQAMIYPVLVLVTALCVIGCLLLFVFPKLEEVFEVFTESSDAVAAKVSSIKAGITFMCFLICILAAAVVLVILLRKKSVNVKRITDRILIKTPVVGKTVKVSDTADFAFAMKVLTSSKVPFVQALKDASEVAGNLYYRKELKSVYQKIMDGNSICDSFSESGVFPQYLISWLLIAETTGNVEKVFCQISDYYSGQSDEIAQTLVTGAEPFFILVTGIFIIVLVAQFVIPVFSLLGEL